MPESRTHEDWRLVDGAHGELAVYGINGRICERVSSRVDGLKIAAAPELLEAIMRVEDQLIGRSQSDWFDIRVRIAVQEAIAKATAAGPTP